MLKTDMLEVAQKMRGPSGRGRVLVFDVDYSANKYGIFLGTRASRHAYYLRPPEGMHATELKQILDAAGGEEELTFRYYVYPELQTDLKPLLTADPYAGKYFERDEERKFLQIEGERATAREVVGRLLQGLKDPFDPNDFPRINEFKLSSFKPSIDGGRAELVLLRMDGSRDELRRSEPGFHIAVAEHGLAKEVEIHRPVVAETEPMLILNSNDNTSELGHRFLFDMAAYFGSDTYAVQSKVSDAAAADRAAAATAARPASSHSPVARASDFQQTKLDDRQLVGKVAAAMKELMPGMALLKKREFAHSGPYLTIQFPGVLGFGKGPSANEIKELRSILGALKADPSFGSGWQARYQVDDKTGEMRISASFDTAPTQGWTAL